MPLTQKLSCMNTPCSLMTDGDGLGDDSIKSLQGHVLKLSQLCFLVPMLHWMDIATSTSSNYSSCAIEIKISFKSKQLGIAYFLQEDLNHNHILLFINISLSIKQPCDNTHF